ncbi:MAG: diadenosine tetraphosphate hydrolase [Kordiimonadales bacterium]|nr:MAG: diadenosine tetraphosphate hydrolase [Kordiimonadales bacterium]
MEKFELHPQLRADTVEVCQLHLCTVLLAKDATYPWVVLVPMRFGIREVHELSAADQLLLMRETALVSAKMQSLFSADKMNIAALGNMVPQFHMHVVARFKTDAAWPAPIWGAVPAKAYAVDAWAARIEQLTQVLA